MFEMVSCSQSDSILLTERPLSGRGNSEDYSLIYNANNDVTKERKIVAVCFQWDSVLNIYLPTWCIHRITVV